MCGEFVRSICIRALLEKQPILAYLLKVLHVLLSLLVLNIKGLSTDIKSEGTFVDFELYGLILKRIP